MSTCIHGYKWYPVVIRVPCEQRIDYTALNRRLSGRPPKATTDTANRDGGIGSTETKEDS